MDVKPVSKPAKTMNAATKYLDDFSLLALHAIEKALRPASSAKLEGINTTRSPILLREKNVVTYGLSVLNETKGVSKGQSLSKYMLRINYKP